MLHIRDKETDRLARELAERRGVSITEAVREALLVRIASLGPKPQSLWERTSDVRERLKAQARLAGNSSGEEGAVD